MVSAFTISAEARGSSLIALYATCRTLASPVSLHCDRQSSTTRIDFAGPFSGFIFPFPVVYQYYARSTRKDLPSKVLEKQDALCIA